MRNRALYVELEDFDPDLPVKIDGIKEPLDISGASLRTGEDGQQYIALQTAPRAPEKPSGYQGRHLA